MQNPVAAGLPDAKRHPVTWLGLAARLALVALVVILALVGFLFITRGTAVRHVRGVGRDRMPLAPSEPEFPASVTLLTGVSLSTGNRVALAMAALPYLEASHGALICVGSTLSDRGVPLQSIYCASKHAIKGWIDSLRVELQREGSPVRVTLIKPSSINTPLFNKAKTQLGVMPQPISPVYEPELAADAILPAAASNERDVFVGGAGKLLSTAERMSPKLVDLQQRRQGFEAQKTDWPKSADAEHNLYEPVDHDGGVRGDFIDGSHHHSVYQRVDAHGVASAAGAAAACALGAMIVTRTSRERTLGLALRAGALAFAGKALIAALPSSYPEDRSIRVVAYK